MAQEAQPITSSPLTFARLVRDNLTHLRSLTELHRPPPKRQPDPGQGMLFAT